MKSMGAYYWYVKIPQCGYMEYGLKYIAFYVQKHIYNTLHSCHNFPAGSHQTTRGARIYETSLFKLELRSGTPQFGLKSLIFLSCVTLKFDVWA